MMGEALTPRPWLSPRSAWGFRVCAREPQCWVEPSVSLPGARAPEFWCRSDDQTNPWRGRGAPEMAARTPRIRIMIADDHAILRAGLKMLVNAQADMEVVAEAPDGELAVQVARETRPDVA